MKIGAINNRRISFGRALTSSELTDYRETLTQAKKIAGNDGKSILIVHDACLPQNPGTNTGVGNLSAKKSLEFFDFMHNLHHFMNNYAHKCIILHFDKTKQMW